MTDNPKRSLPDIDNLIAQVESLRRRIRLVQKKDFRTPVQKEILAQRADTPWKLALFHHTHPNQFDEEFGVIDRYFRPTGSLDRGRFVQDIGTVRSGQIIESSETQPHYELYNPQRHHPSKKLIERYDFNEKALRDFLKSYTSVKRREYWDKSIKPQIEKIDLGLTPWIRLAKDYDIDVRNPLVIQTVDNADPGKLDQLIYDLKRLQQVKDSKTPNRINDKVGGMIKTQGQARKVKMRLEQYRLFLTDLASDISSLLANDKTQRGLFRTNCEKVRNNGKLAEWMEWYYKPKAINTFQPPDANFTPTEQEQIQAAYCALAVTYDCVIVPQKRLSTITTGEMKDIVESLIDKPRLSPTTDFGYLDRTRARLMSALEFVKAKQRNTGQAKPQDHSDTVTTADNEESKGGIITPSEPVKKAIKSYEWVIKEKPDLLEKIQKDSEDGCQRGKRKINQSKETRWYSKDMYDYIKENGPFYENDPQKPSKMIGFEAWGRYLRKYDQCRRSGYQQPSAYGESGSIVSLHQKNVVDEDLRKMSSRFDSDNPT